jgi:hypothetical protein
VFQTSGVSNVRQKLVQIIGLAVTMVYALTIVWLYATEQRSFKEVATDAPGGRWHLPGRSGEVRCGAGKQVATSSN